MNLFEIRRLIIESWKDSWHYLPEGPLFNYNLGTAGDAATVLGWHDARAVLIEDVDVAIEFGLSADPFENRRDWSPEWAKFPDPTVQVEFCDIYYRNALVDRISMVRVDGGRALLPLPNRDDGRWIVFDWPYHLARVINDLQDHREFDSYFSRSGFYKWPA